MKAPQEESYHTILTVLTGQRQNLSTHLEWVVRIGEAAEPMYAGLRALHDEVQATIVALVEAARDDYPKFMPRSKWVLLDEAELARSRQEHLEQELAEKNAQISCASVRDGAPANDGGGENAGGSVVAGERA